LMEVHSIPARSDGRISKGRRIVSGYRNGPTTCSPAPARGAKRQIDESRLLTDQDEGLFTNSAYTRRRLISDILRPLF
jgi:hypothetical protein